MRVFPLSRTSFLRRRESILILLLSCVAPVAAAATPWQGTWSGTVTHRERTMRVAIEVPASPDAPALVDYADVPVYAAPFKWRVEDDALTLRREPVGGPLSTLRLERRNDALHGVFNGAGAVDAPVLLERDAAAPARLRETSLAFANGRVQLAGTVVWPAGDGPFAAVVISHGSGEGHRDQALYRTDAFRYARHGVAALIYDKRGCGDSTGDWRVASLHDLARDALAGLRALQRSTASATIASAWRDTARAAGSRHSRRRCRATSHSSS